MVATKNIPRIKKCTHCFLILLLLICITCGFWYKLLHAVSIIPLLFLFHTLFLDNRNNGREEEIPIGGQEDVILTIMTIAGIVIITLWCVSLFFFAKATLGVTIAIAICYAVSADKKTLAEAGVQTKNTNGE